jgi:hypothetical protein
MKIRKKDNFQTAKGILDCLRVKSDQENANHDYTEIPSHPSQNGDHQENLGRWSGSSGRPPA